MRFKGGDHETSGYNANNRVAVPGGGSRGEWRYRIYHAEGVLLSSQIVPDNQKQQEPGGVDRQGSYRTESAGL